MLNPPPLSLFIYLSLPIFRYLFKSIHIFISSNLSRFIHAYLFIYQSQYVHIYIFIFNSMHCLFKPVYIDKPILLCSYLSIHLSQPIRIHTSRYLFQFVHIYLFHLCNIFTYFNMSLSICKSLWTHWLSFQFPIRFSVGTIGIAVRKLQKNKYSWTLVYLFDGTHSSLSSKSGNLLIWLETSDRLPVKY